jgi:catechol 2,3-dioxygenase-like lactoylglutathione lyase family enzyme
MTVDIEKLRAAISETQPPFALKKLGHVVIKVTNLERSLAFYAGVLGFKVSDIIGEDRMPGGMIFMRCNPDHHGIALIGGAPAATQRYELHHMAFEAASLDDIFRARDHLRAQGVTLVFEGRRGAGAQVLIEFLDPDGHHIEFYWGIDQIGADGVVRPPHEWRSAKSLEEAVANPPVDRAIVK